ncbi:MAG: outer membrane beta-barrel protein, partial [Candidatus Kapabacteria bacterium]|nr:outer membrane beta-barrel protein [Candidatus Kapabacteria bacterium]
MSTLLLQGTLVAQSHQGDVVGSLSGSVHKYHGEFSDDMFGPGAALSLRYAALDRLWIEARFGLGEYRWKITDAKLARYPEYFGQSAQLGDLYPGSRTAIETENESRLTTADLLVSYVLVDNIPASPFLTVGLGLVNTAPSNSSEHSALPNYERGSYPHSAISVLVGGGVQIPISRRVGLLLRAEHRFVFSEYLDDVAFNGKNDALSSFSIGFTYRFNDSHDQSYQRCCDEMSCEERCVDNCGDECESVDDCKQRCLDGLCECCSRDCAHCCPQCCCCCCCCKNQGAAAPAAGGGGSGGGGDPAPAPPAPPSEPSSGGGPKPEPMEVPCPVGQHRECFGPPGFGICV